MKNIGIWLDSDKAIIIKINSSNEVIKKQHIDSNIEHSHFKAGVGSNRPYRFQAVKSEKHLLEKKKHQLNTYFQEITNNIKDANHILIFGPAEAKIEFQKMLLKQPSILHKNITVQTADSMTENQIVAYIKNFFKDEE